jgi:hypothetical protein
MAEMRRPIAECPCGVFLHGARRAPDGDRRPAATETHAQARLVGLVLATIVFFGLV